MKINIKPAMRMKLDLLFKYENNIDEHELKLF